VQQESYANIFEVLQKVGDGFPLILGEHILVQGIAGFAYNGQRTGQP
jgi:hypothetical protein